MLCDVLLGASSLAFPFSPNLPSLFVLRIISGACSAGEPHRGEYCARWLRFFVNVADRLPLRSAAGVWTSVLSIVAAASGGEATMFGIVLAFMYQQRLSSSLLPPPPRIYMLFLEAPQRFAVTGP